jgi:hypothetical protein
MSRIRSLFVLSVLALSGAYASAAQWIVNQDLGSLNGAGTYYLTFQLTDGSLLGNETSTVNIFDLTLTGGVLGPALPNLGNVSGDPTGSLVLKDGPGAGNEVADYTVEFSILDPAAALRFVFDWSVTSIDAPADYFTFQILDGSLNPLVTSGPNGVEFVALGLDATSGLSPFSYAVDGAFAQDFADANNGDRRYLDLGAPKLTVVPEPATLLCLALGLAALKTRRRRHQA